MSYFEQARRFLPNSSRIPVSLALVARRRGQWDRSESYFNEGERLDPRNVSVFTQHALTYMCLRRFSKRCGSLIRFWIYAPDDLYTVAAKAAIPKARAICRVHRRC